MGFVSCFADSGKENYITLSLTLSYAYAVTAKLFAIQNLALFVSIRFCYRPNHNLQQIENDPILQLSHLLAIHASSTL